MTSTPVQIPEPGRAPAPARRIGPGRVALVVIGAFSSMIGIATLIAGAALLVGWSHRDASGFLNAGPATLRSDTYAMTTDLDVHVDGPAVVYPEGMFGKVRVQAASTGKPVFIGVGPTDEVADYLSGVRHDQVRDVEVAPLRVSTTTTDGGAPATAPGDQTFWLATDSGTGTRSVTWTVRPGDWSVVIMNADGSATVESAVSVGASVPVIGGVGVGLVVGGLFAVTVGLGLVVLPLTTAGRSRTA
jgi:hypothetical protein